MTAWADRWDANVVERCEAGHDRHDRLRVPVRLCPRTRPTDDCPACPIPITFDFQVFDADRYAGFPAYCTGDDELSRSMVEQACWEPWQTAVAVAVLAAHPERAVIDLGSHVGWYSMLAMSLGHRVYALDADVEHVAVSMDNATTAGLAYLHEPAVGWLDAESTPIDAGEVGHVRLAKVDLEGAEGIAADMLVPLLADRALDYALVELSPEFGAGWRHVLTVFDVAGYGCHLLPDKGDDLDAFELDPLGFTLAQPAPSDLDVQATVLLASPAI